MNKPLKSCIPVQMWSYEPVDESERVEQSYKGLTSIYYRRMLDSSSGFSISAGGNNKNEFKIFFQLSIAKNTHIKINEWILRLSSDNFDNDLIIPIEKMSISV